MAAAAAAMLEIQVQCYKMGNYHLISMKIGTQTKKNILIEMSPKSGSLRQKNRRN
jgi:hypothetical protein